MQYLFFFGIAVLCVMLSGNRLGQLALYGMIQLFVALAIPLLKAYSGERGKWNGMKYVFYLYYPLHLVLCGVVRILLHGNIGVIIGG